MIHSRRLGNAAIVLIAGLLLALPWLRAELTERTYGAAANCDGCLYWVSLGNDAWLAGIGLIVLALGLVPQSRGLRTLLAALAFALALAMLVDTLLLDLLSLRLHMADVLKFGGEGEATAGFLMAALRGGYWPLWLALLIVLVVVLLLGFGADRKPRVAMTLALLAACMLAVGPKLGHLAEGYIHSEGVVNLFQLQRMRGANTPYSAEFARRLLAKPMPAAGLCEAGQRRHPDVLLVIAESLSAHHSALLGGHDFLPELDAIARDNTWFTAFHANGFTTDHGLIALLDGRAPIPAVGRYLSLHAFAGFGDPERSVAGVLRPAGYWTGFFTTGNLSFLDKTSWLRRMQLDHFEGSESPYYNGMPRGGFDAAADEALFGRFLLWLDQERDPARPFFAALLTVDTHPPFLDHETGKLDEETVFRRADAALGDLYRQLAERNFFDHGILLVTGDHRSMTAVQPDEWLRHGDSALARVPMVVAGASGLPDGPVAGAFQQTDLRPSLAQLVAEGEVCRTTAQGTFLRSDPQPAGHVIHARGDRRGRIDVYYQEGTGWIDLAGDASRIGGILPQRTAVIAEAVHRDRIERGELPQDMSPLLMDLSRERMEQAQGMQ
ncbi:MAG: sulfatase-like hydrolase/transferase [Lysobacteraceae bacterium]